MFNEVKITYLRASYKGHLNKKWISDSTEFVWQCMHNCYTYQFQWQVTISTFEFTKHSIFIYWQIYKEVAFSDEQFFIDPVGSEFIVIFIFVIIVESKIVWYYYKRESDNRGMHYIWISLEFTSSASFKLLLIIHKILFIYSTFI